MGRYLARHNSKILNNKGGLKCTHAPKCNCQKSRKGECPLPGECNQMGFIYQAQVDILDKQEFYVGLAKDFKQRWRKHRDSLKYEDFDNHTKLSKYVWQKRGEGFNLKVKWRILERNVCDFNPTTGVCRLCTREKYRIVLEPSSATLNKRTELFAPCRHMAAYLIEEPPN